MSDLFQLSPTDRDELVAHRLAAQDRANATLAARIEASLDERLTPILDAVAELRGVIASALRPEPEQPREMPALAGSGPLVGAALAGAPEADLPVIELGEDEEGPSAKPKSASATAAKTAPASKPRVVKRWI